MSHFVIHIHTIRTTPVISVESTKSPHASVYRGSVREESICAGEVVVGAAVKGDVNGVVVIVDDAKGEVKDTGPAGIEGGVLLEEDAVLVFALGEVDGAGEDVLVAGADVDVEIISRIQSLEPSSPVWPGFPHPTLPALGLVTKTRLMTRRVLGSREQIYPSTISLDLKYHEQELRYSDVSVHVGIEGTCGGWLDAGGTMMRPGVPLLLRPRNAGARGISRALSCHCHGCSSGGGGGGTGTRRTVRRGKVVTTEKVEYKAYLDSAGQAPVLSGWHWTGTALSGRHWTALDRQHV